MVSWVEPELSPAAQQLCQQMATWAAAERPSAPEVAAMRMGDAPSRRAARVALWRAHAQLAAQADGESASEALEALSALQQLDGLCADAIAHVQRASGCLDLVAQRHAGLEAQSSALQRQTAVHSGHLAGTQALADALETRLSPFRALATHRRLLEAPGLPATHPDLLPALEALDRAIAGVAGSASTARDSASLLVELRTAQASGLRAIAAHIASALNSAASSALSALRDWSADPPPNVGGEGRPLLSSADGAFLQAVHVRFQTLATTLRPWIEQLERRAPLHREAAAVLLDAQGAYLEARAPLLRAALVAMLGRLAADASADSTADAAGGAGVLRLPVEKLADAARRAIGWFARVMSLERELHEAFFRSGVTVRLSAVGPGGAVGTLSRRESEATFSSLGDGAVALGSGGISGALEFALDRSLGGVCALLADWLRPTVIQANSVEHLADLALALREEAASASKHTPEAPVAATGGGGRGALGSAIERVLGDVQDRLAFRAQIDLRENVRTFRPTTEDVHFPERLELARDAARARADTPAMDGAAGSGGGGDGAVRYEVPWYPPAEATLRCLAVLYRAVDRLTFSSLAAEGVAEATGALLDGSARVAARSGELHGRLFLVRQLLTLREQLAPFDAEWEVVEKTLDLSNMRGWLLSEISSRRALASPLSFFRGMLTSNRPAIVERHKDAKASLEAELKASCEGLIAHVSAQLTQPLLPFLVRYGTATATGGAEAEGSGVGEALPSAEACAKILQETVACVEERLPALHGALSLYLNNAITLAILFRPMKTAVSDALQQYSAVAQRAMQDAERDALDVPGQLGRVRSALDAYG